ncbi:nephrin-like [Portunus trituberculatus]|uniref:nephrin-like n=1 Tax=Portunus trituberculatus TaxID=210409 RepID=UPI001E1D143F|nr:nephrin-like [Portunus trituberculatus]
MKDADEYEECAVATPSQVNILITFKTLPSSVETPDVALRSSRGGRGRGGGRNGRSALRRRPSAQRRNCHPAVVPGSSHHAHLQNGQTDAGKERYEQEEEEKKGNKKEEETEDEEEVLIKTGEGEDENLVTVDRPRLWWDDGRVGDRARLEVAGPRVVLRVSRLKDEDKGLYTCRVDFRHQPTKTTRVNLTVVEPPERVEIQVEGKESRLVSPGRASVTQVGPYLEGQTVHLTCIARGGSPRPQVSWHSGTRLLDASMESDAEEVDVENTTTSPEAANLSLTAARRTQEPPPELEEPHNVLTLGPLRRHHLHLVLTCEASNNNITSPVSLAVAIDMSLPPLSVHLSQVPEAPLVAGRQYTAECEVVGARPPPAVTWRIGQRPPLPQAEVTTLEGGNITRSRLLFIPGRKDDGSIINCTAFTASPNTTLSASHYLAVHYLPSAWSSFGSSLDWSNIKEGDDVYFECTIDANPPVTRVTWKHNDAPLAHNVSAGIIVSNQSLVLQKVVRAQAGRYSCLAHNAVGTSASNTLRLDVKFAPVCSPGQVTTYAVGKYEDAEVTCSVDANPTQESYQWTFNNTADTIDVPQGRFTSLSSHSAITYTPMTSLDYGTLLCWAANPIGTQKVPCVFHIVPAGKPEPPTNCTVVGGGASEVRVRCEAGGSGGLPQHFLLTATPTHLSHPLLPTAPPQRDCHGGARVSGGGAGGGGQVPAESASGER